MVRKKDWDKISKREISKKGKNHLIVRQVNKNGDITWEMTYLDRRISFSRMEDFCDGIIDLIVEAKKRKK
jgi:hypothetical protein